ncbi:MAG: glycine C-acetyltransferase [bacterium TMED198]|nr:MAG: glycine C-acetyltransferase [bacterium TMED198]
MEFFLKYLSDELNNIKEEGLYKSERVISSSQSTTIDVNRSDVLNFCANNYLGLSNNPMLIKAAKEGIDKWGFGLSSVRFICGTQEIHKTLEEKISGFLHQEDTILYTSCFDANGGLFETLLGSNDAIISDALNHASIIDGVRLSKAKRFRYPNSDMNALEQMLKDSQDCRTRLITTDGVFSMDGYVARLDDICNLAEKYNALVHVDDSHATGFFGKSGRGSVEYKNVIDRVHIITSTLGKALGGASGGFTSGKKEIIDMLRQRSRPYLFSNTVAPAIVCASIAAIDLISNSSNLIDKLNENTNYFRNSMKDIGFDIKDGVHPIVPVMIYDAKKAQLIASDMLDEGVYVIGFSFPVVPKGEARIRVQLSALHSKEEIDIALSAFEKAGHKHEVIQY